MEKKSEWRALCVNAGHLRHITEGLDYEVLEMSDCGEYITVLDNDGDPASFSVNRFEVLP